jgi:hypothetical protein
MYAAYMHDDRLYDAVLADTYDVQHCIHTSMRYMHERLYFACITQTFMYIYLHICTYVHVCTRLVYILHLMCLRHLY